MEEEISAKPHPVDAVNESEDDALFFFLSGDLINERLGDKDDKNGNEHRVKKFGEDRIFVEREKMFDKSFNGVIPGKAGDKPQSGCDIA